jgi:hypothetical protein
MPWTGTPSLGGEPLFTLCKCNDLIGGCHVSKHNSHVSSEGYFNVKP